LDATLELNQHVQCTTKDGRGSIIVWGCMSWKGIGKLHLIEGKMHRYIYQEILETVFIETIRMQGLEEVIIFQHDNDPKHIANYVA